MKNKLFFLSLCFGTNICFGQLRSEAPNSGGIMDFTDLNGRSLINKYEPDVTGSPFLNNNWVPAKITLSKGKVIGPMNIKLNLESNELYYRDSTGNEMIAIEGLIKKIECYSFSKDDKQYIFKSGYPPVDKQNENYYYRVYTQGKIELLVKKSKYIRVTKNELSGETSKEFVESADFLYVYANNSIQAFHPKESNVMSLLKDKEKEINKFLNTTDINFKKIPDLIQLFNYYNSLQ
jgi:hypothetical protein